ncbi:MAG: hypothetical protein QXH17_06725 [Candidatus Bathyarchaeia archaeon]|nr:hypothetical protein [Candidatus Bathyarchaeota archaeon]
MKVLGMNQILEGPHIKNRILEIIELASNPPLTYYESQGILLETLVDLALDILGIKHSSNPYDTLEWKRRRGLGVDHETEAYQIEDKNYREHYLLTPKTIRGKILKRYDQSSKKKRLLIISKLNCSKEALDYLSRNGVRILQIGLFITPNKTTLIKALQTLLFKLSILFKIRGVFSSTLMYINLYVYKRILRILILKKVVWSFWDILRSGSWISLCPKPPFLLLRCPRSPESCEYFKLGSHPLFVKHNLVSHDLSPP